jgi:hypothetical protein
MRLTRGNAGAIGVALTLLSGSLVPAAGQTFTYPSNGQSAQQESRDRGECHQWAVQQTGVDPASAAAMPAAPPPSAPPPGRGVARGALRGAAVGSVGGAISGDAGKGAAAGAAMGGLIGGMRTRDQYAGQQDAYAQQQSQAQQASASRLDAYNRALNACLAGRGYTVR